MRFDLHSSGTIVLTIAAAVVTYVPAGADIGGDPGEAHAILGAEVVVAPGAVPAVMTVLLREGKIVAVGDDVSVPAGVRTYDLSGRTIYPGLFEPYLRLDAEEIENEYRTGSVHPNPRVRSETRVVERLPLGPKQMSRMRDAGFTHGFVANGSGLFRGTGAVLGFVDEEMHEHVLTADAAHAFAFERSGWPSTIPPGSLMGAIALTRQTLFDAMWHRDAEAAARRSSGEIASPPANRSLESLIPLTEGRTRWVVESEDLRMFERVARLAREFELAPIVIAGGSDEYRDAAWVMEQVSDVGVSLVLTLNTPPAPYWEYEDQRSGIELDALLHWELAPSNPAIVAETGLDFAVSSQGLKTPADVHEHLRVAIERGLPKDVALAALTTVPAEFYGLADRVGTIEPGRNANLTITSGELFAKDTKVVEVWIDGRRFFDPPPRARPEDVAGRWEFRSEAPLSTVVFEEADGELSGYLEPAGDDTTFVTAPTVLRGVLAFTTPWGSFTGYVEGDIVRGIVEREGVTASAWGIMRSKPDDADDEDADATDESPLSADAPPWPMVLGDEPQTVVVKGATLWTSADRGVIERGDLLVRDGVIRGVGEVNAPDNALVIDGAGLHVTPGLVDAHSHSAISGGVNEGTESATCEVRIADVLNPRSVEIYRELAGGLTVSNMLHGSANVIGGQNAVIKMRWGARADELLFERAPAGVKFALGENVKQSNWGENYTTRYPQTRMGVEQFVRDRFLAARDYVDARKRGTDPATGWPVRRDLELDAIAEVLAGDRLIHCHSYRQDEILMLIRVMEEFGVRIGTFQHVLEGYKVADEIAAHGAGASCFSDWWAYKYEVIDAIPYAGRIMWERGVLTSFNSDSRDLSRRMNLEAAKAVKYGRVPEAEALKFVTSNPAKQLGIDRWVGSLEVGKHGDFAVWSDHPLSDRAICLQTWIEGVKRFDREADVGAREEMFALREALLDRAEAAQEKTPAAFEPTFGRLYGEFASEGVGFAEEQGACGGCGLDWSCAATAGNGGVR